MIVLVTGGRNYVNATKVCQVLDSLHGGRNVSVLVHGACTGGADAHADMWALLRGVQVRPFFADWAKHGLWAGPKRNQAMVEYVAGFRMETVLVVAFPGGRGTRDCVRRAETFGLRVERVT